MWKQHVSDSRRSFAAAGAHLAQRLPQGVTGGRRHDCSRDSTCTSEPEQRQGHPPTRVSLGRERRSITLRVDNPSTPERAFRGRISFSRGLPSVRAGGFASQPASAAVNQGPRTRRSAIFSSPLLAALRLGATAPTSPEDRRWTFVAVKPFRCFVECQDEPWYARAARFVRLSFVGQAHEPR